MSDLFFIGSLVRMIQGGKPVGTATGFFYGRGNSVYFVTNRHVVLEESKGIKPEILRVRLHASPDDLTQNVERDIALYEQGKAKWHVHKDYASKEIDIAVIEIDAKALTSGTFIKVLAGSNFFPDQFLITPGEDVMVIGFPRGVSDTLHNLPLTRSALISSAYGIEFEGRPMFLVDSNLHPGMSASPVVTRPKNMWQDKEGQYQYPYRFPNVFCRDLFRNTERERHRDRGRSSGARRLVVREIDRRNNRLNLIPCKRTEPDSKPGDVIDQFQHTSLLRMAAIAQRRARFGALAVLLQA